MKFCNYFLPFVKLYKRWEPETNNQTVKHRFLTDIRTYAHKYYLKFNRNKMYSPIFSKNDIELRSTLSKKKDLIFLRPYKTWGIVLMDKRDYVDNTLDILGDRSKFKPLPDDDPYKIALRYQDRIKDF